MAENKKYNYNNSFGRIQFLANLELIKDNLDKGHTLKSIYSELVKTNKVTCSYQSFSRYKTIFLGFSNNCKGKRKIQEENKNEDKLKNKLIEQVKNNKNQSTPSQKVSFTESASYSDLIRNIEKRRVTNGNNSFYSTRKRRCWQKHDSVNAFPVFCRS